MTKAEHTPGPWHVYAPKFKAGRGIGPGPGWIVARTTPCRDGQGQHHSKANARLISAAPDLLAALEKSHEIIFALHESETNAKAKRVLADQMTENTLAISKAKS